MDFDFNNRPSPDNPDTAILVDILNALFAAIEGTREAAAAQTCNLDKRSLAIAVTHIETASLWLANSQRQ